jgi:acetoin utilization deacetylase AcuC-like enzyme
MLTVLYSDRYEINLPGHIWPTSKYRLIAERLRNERIDLREPHEASWDDLALVHTPEYLSKIRHNRLTADDIATLELPWHPELVEGFRLMVGGTCQAAAAALDLGLAAHLGGGLHHAFANHGEGFCLFNDVAVAVRTLQRDGRLQRAAVVDCDVHHGNGTAMIFERDPSVFTFSIHQQHNYPVFKPRSDLDIGLEDGAGDERYLSALEAALPSVLANRPDLVVYLAGADPFEGDRLGGLAVTKKGLQERDRLVLSASRRAGVPMVTVLAGGYALDVTDTVDVHVATIMVVAGSSQEIRRAGDI